MNSILFQPLMVLLGQLAVLDVLIWCDDNAAFWVSSGAHRTYGPFANPAELFVAMIELSDQGLL